METVFDLFMLFIIATVFGAPLYYAFRTERS